MTHAHIHAAALQFPVTMDVAANLAALESLLVRIPRHALAVAPEGVLSGYLPRPGFVSAIDQSVTHRALDRAAALARDKHIHLVVGACIYEQGAWRNASYIFTPAGAHHRYDKINLANSERGTFEPGDTLPVFALDIDGAQIRLGVQMCRELRYPEQWRVLAAQGAEIIAYPNNAIGSPKGDTLWRAHLISRAAEIQRFIVGANNAAPDQTCPSAILAPSGDILAECTIGATISAAAALALDQNADAVLAQARDDVVSVRLARD